MNQTTQASLIADRHDEVEALERDAEFQCCEIWEDPLRLDGELYEAKTYIFRDRSALTVAEDPDGEDGGGVIIVVCPTAPRRLQSEVRH